jgi:hypothetical protein
MNNKVKHKVSGDIHQKWLAMRQNRIRKFYGAVMNNKVAMTPAVAGILLANNTGWLKLGL